MLFHNALVRATLLFLFYGSFISCKKEKEEVVKDNQSAKSLMDSIYLYGQQVYYWNNQLPNEITFNNYKNSLKSSDDLENLKAGLFYISQFAKNRQTGRKYELSDIEGIGKYTTILAPEQQKDNLLNGFGINITSINNSSLLVKYVIPNSPAARKGLKRGDEILSINGLKSQNITDYKNIFAANKLNISYLTNASEQRLLELEKSNYSPNSIINYQIINDSYGYISLLNFPSHFNDLDKIFQTFASKGIKNLIIDLRYNMGGFLSGCDEFVNYMITDKLHNKVYRKEVYNTTLQERKATILKNKPVLDQWGVPIFFIENRVGTFYDIDYSLENNIYFFNKLGTFNTLNKVYFIVSNETASASELLINSLDPYVDMEIIGVSNNNEQTKVYTYGKPVGSIAIPIGQYSIYYAMFQNINAKNQGDYFEGISSDWTTIDDLRKDFGDIADPAIKHCVGIGTKAKVKPATVLKIKMQEIYQEIPQRPVLIKEFPIAH